MRLSTKHDATTGRTKTLSLFSTAQYRAAMRLADERFAYVVENYEGIDVPLESIVPWLDEMQARTIPQTIACVFHFTSWRRKPEPTPRGWGFTIR